MISHLRRSLILALVFSAVSASGWTALAGDAEELEKQVLELEDAFVDAVKAIRPTVVAIQVTGIESGDPEIREPRERDEPIEPAPRRNLQPAPAGGMGSGVIISADGYILTNHHVAGSARTIVVTLLSGERLAAEIVGTNPRGDLTLLKIPGDDHPFAELAPDDSARPGAWAIAMGNPFTLGADGKSVVTLGVVSGVHRIQAGTTTGELYYGSALQTDAEINPGNSGGPLFDVRGRLIGINGRIANARGQRVNVGVGFAISARQVRRFLPALKRGGTVEHGFLGVRYATREVDTDGIEVTFVFPGSPADTAGLEPGDRIVGFDGRRIDSGVRFSSVMSTLPEGAPVAVEVRRGERALTFDVRLTRRPDGGS